MGGMTVITARCAIAVVFAIATIAGMMGGARAAPAMSLQIAGLYLGMPLEEFRMSHSAVIISRTTPVHYCYGRPIARENISTLKLRVNLGLEILWVDMTKYGAAYRIATIKSRRETSHDPEGIRRIHESLVRQFGPADRILRRRKFEPAGLIVGFRWTVPGAASLTAKIHRDHAGDPRRIYLTRTLTSPAPMPRTPARRRPAASCTRQDRRQSAGNDRLRP